MAPGSSGPAANRRGHGRGDRDRLAVRVAASPRGALADSRCFASAGTAAALRPRAGGGWRLLVVDGRPRIAVLHRRPRRRGHAVRGCARQSLDQTVPAHGEPGVRGRGIALAVVPCRRAHAGAARCWRGRDCGSAGTRRRKCSVAPRWDWRRGRGYWRAEPVCHVRRGTVARGMRHGSAGASMQRDGRTGTPCAGRAGGHRLPRHRRRRDRPARRRSPARDTRPGRSSCARSARRRRTGW